MQPWWVAQRAQLGCRDVGSKGASTSGRPSEELEPEDPVHILERVGFPRQRQYTQVKFSGLGSLFDI